MRTFSSKVTVAFVATSSSCVLRRLLVVASPEIRARFASFFKVLISSCFSLTLFLQATIAILSGRRQLCVPFTNDVPENSDSFGQLLVSVFQVAHLRLRGLAIDLLSSHIPWSMSWL